MNRQVLWMACAALMAGSHVLALSQTFTKVTTGSPVTELGAWRSVNWVDVDHDGDLDLFVTRGRAGGQDNVLFRNEGPPDYAFTRMSGLAISQDHEPSDGSSWADYDNDGRLDCFVANWYNRNNLLYHNEGGDSLARILLGPVVTDFGYSETGSWGDYNNDGLIDLYVANSEGSLKNFLYKNIGGGQFARVLTGAPAEDAHHSRGVTWVDYDDDGDLDLFVANESNENEALYKNMLKETGVDTFARVSGDPLVTDGGSTWSASWADYDEDGDLDVFLTNQNGPNALFINQGNGTFVKGEVFEGTWSATAGWADVDNDGDLDLVVTTAYGPTASTNVLYQNLLRETGVAVLQQVFTEPMVSDSGFSYGLSWGDYDNDGDLDLFVARTFGENQTNVLYRNNGNANHWLSIDCVGTQSNAAAIGTKVRAKAMIHGQPVWQLQVVEGQSGYCGQNLQLHFGLGDAASVDSLYITWPSGNVEIMTGVAANQRLSVTEKVPYTLRARGHWNLISVPANVTSLQPSLLMPAALSSWFRYDGPGTRYVTDSVLAYGVGYWVRLTPEQVVRINGLPRVCDTVDVEEGWNLIGSISTPIATFTIASIPGGLVTSKFYGYNGSYQQSDSIKPMSAYWVKASQKGKLILSANGSAQGLAQRISIMSSTDVPPNAPAGEFIADPVPATYGLHQNYPNPFNPSTAIRYQLPEASEVRLTVHTLLGEEVATLVGERQEAGFKSVEWNAGGFPSGCYFVRLEARRLNGGREQPFVEVRKTLLLR